MPGSELFCHVSCIGRGTPVAEWGRRPIRLEKAPFEGANDSAEHAGGHGRSIGLAQPHSQGP